ncbi:Formylglycine-generating enzyme [Methanosarcinales archaeon]|nr:Formylglycine-generating enzyme [Methanosarcinales archaeon]
MVVSVNISESNEELLKGLFEDIKDTSKKCIAFVGAGLSNAPPAEIPTWKTTFLKLCDYCASMGLEDIANKQKEIAFQADYDPEFLTVCFEKLRNTMKQPVYETAMKNILKPKNPGSSPAIKSLVNIQFEGVITTNLDMLIEDASGKAYKNGERPEIMKIITSSDGNIQGTLSRRQNWIWKIHGTIERPETWIFTSSEYSKSIYSNPTYCEALKGVIQGARLVFLGFGGSDPDIDQILSLLSGIFGGREDQHILLTRDGKKLKLDKLAYNNIRVIEYGGPEDHSALNDLLEQFPHFSHNNHIITDFDDSNYREWLTSETDSIDIRGIGISEGRGANRFPILDLYAKLYIRSKLSNSDLDKGRIRGGQRVELLEMAKAVRCLAIVGDPGSGKTTFLRYLARNELSNPNNPLPFYIRLGDVYEFSKTKEIKLSPQILLDYLVDLSKRLGLNLTPNGLENRINHKQCWFLLDGLDELPDADRENIVRVIEDAPRLWKSCRFILTSRPQAMTGKSIPLDFEVVGIDQLQDDEIRSFLEAWTKLLFKNASENLRQQHCDSLLYIIRRRPEIHLLARNPVMLTSMAVIHYNEKLLPEGRADLLEAVIKWLIHAKDRFQGSERKPSKFTEKMYREIALAMFDDNEGRKIYVGRLWTAKIIAKHFDGDEEKALEFLKREETETGILVRRGEGDLAFWHLSFQEYLSAEEIAGKTDDIKTGWWPILQKNLEKTEWREVICLVPACLNRLGSERVNLFLERLSEQYENADLSLKARGVGLGGCILKDLRVYGYEPKNVASWAKISNEIRPIFEEGEQEISLEDRYNAAVAYGLGGDNRLRNFEDTWISLQGGTFYMGAKAYAKDGLNFDPDATEWEMPVTKITLSPFEIRKYLITVAEFDQFVLDGGYEENSASEYWTKEGWEWRSKNNIIEPTKWDEQRFFPNCPVSGISLFEAKAYCRWLTMKELRKIKYRLPSEAEWEYAARQGLKSGQRFPWGNNLTKGELAEANWLGSNLGRKTPIGMFPKSNTVDGITDMIGNVEEWCEDSWSWSHENYFQNGTPRVIPKENDCIVKGGSTIRVSRLCRPTYRSKCNKEKRYDTIGFRPVRCLIEEKNEQWI